MKKPDDHTLSQTDLFEIRRYADLLLREADAYRRFPTPVSDLISAAKLSVERGVSLDEGFLLQFYKKATHSLKRAIGKVLAFLDVKDRTIYVDHSVHKKRKVFVSLHDTGHDFLPWQRDTYALIEEDEATLDPEIREQFDREANVFASDVLFQLDIFHQEAADRVFSIRTAVQLSKRFGSSCYAAARRYVNTNSRACALIVLNAPVYEIGTGYTATLRRSFQSQAFAQRFGEVRWPEAYQPDHFFMTLIPYRSPFSQPKLCQLRNLNNESETCIIETFNSGYEFFVLLYPENEFASLNASFQI